jgi:arsenate reductase-like glutaredoxin family protein
MIAKICHCDISQFDYSLFAGRGSDDEQELELIMNDSYRAPDGGDKVDGVTIKDGTGRKSRVVVTGTGSGTYRGVDRVVTVDSAIVSKRSKKSNMKSAPLSSGVQSRKNDQSSRKRKEDNNNNNNTVNNDQHELNRTEPQQHKHHKQKQQRATPTRPTIAPSTDLWTRYDLTKEMTDGEMAELKLVKEQAALLSRPGVYNNNNMNCLSNGGISGRMGRAFLFSGPFPKKRKVVDEGSAIGINDSGRPNENEGMDHGDDDNDDWDRMFTRLVLYQREHGHTAVPPPSSRTINNMNHDEDFAIWVQVQRQMYREIVASMIRPPINEIEAIRMVRLQSIGFVWSYSEFIWQAQYDAIQKRLLHCFSQLFMISRIERENGPLLDSTMQDWIKKQRTWMETQRTYRDRATSGEGIASSEIEKVEKLQHLFSDYERLICLNHMRK